MSVLIYVINIPWAHQRRQAISSRLAELKLDYKIISALDGNFISEAERKKHRMDEQSEYKSRLLNAGEQGAVLSHKKAYEQLLKDKAEFALILEDDAVIDERLPLLLNNIGQLPMQWNICYLGYLYDTLGKPFFKQSNYPVSMSERKKLDFLLQGPHYHYLGKFILRPRGAYAYLITSKAARKLLDDSLNQPALIADRALSNCELGGIVGIAPTIVGHADAALEQCIVERPPSDFKYWTLNSRLNRLEAGFTARVPFLASVIRIPKSLIRRIRASVIYLTRTEYNPKNRDYEV